MQPAVAWRAREPLSVICNPPNRSHSQSLTHSRLAVFNVFLAVPKPVLWTLSMMDVSMEGGQGNEAEGLDVEWSRKVELSKVRFDQSAQLALSGKVRRRSVTGRISRAVLWCGRQITLVMRRRRCGLPSC